MGLETKGRIGGDSYASSIITGLCTVIGRISLVDVYLSGSIESSGSSVASKITGNLSVTSSIDEKGKSTNGKIDDTPKSVIGTI